MNGEQSQWVKPIRGDESILLGRDSPLRRIPANVRAQQAVFVDGIRHAVEVMDVGFGRLRAGLTQLALRPPAGADLPLVGATLFLDAWAVVDATDRFRQLYQGFPGMSRGAATPGVTPLQEALESFRKLRNVGDHIAQNADRVVAKGGAAVGELSWLTGKQIQPEFIAWHCVLRPGTLKSEPTLPTEPIESALDWPTDNICLSAGGHTANLSQVRLHIAIRIRHLEAQLAEVFARPEHEHVPVINDFFGRRPVRPAVASDQEGNSTTAGSSSSTCSQ